MGEYLRSHTSTATATLPIHIPAPPDQLCKGWGARAVIDANAVLPPLASFSKLLGVSRKIIPVVSDTSTSPSDRGGSGKAFTEAATASASGPRGAPLGRGQRMRLYQVLAPSQLARGRIFGGKLALKEEWLALDSPYFNAPGEQLLLCARRGVTCI